ncbi:hypothetical protein MOP88_05385 [Sphingomonas sp. WKB10]|nr:hypothetical protein [Sphingomonas sp. WKB10]
MVKSESSSIPARMKGWLPELLLSGAVIAIVGSTAWFKLPVAAWGPALIAALGVMYSRMSSREQVRVAERKLFLDLMQRRVAWLDQLADAVGKRDAEARLMLERLLRGDPRASLNSFGVCTTAKETRSGYSITPFPSWWPN